MPKGFHDQSAFDKITLLQGGGFRPGADRRPYLLGGHTQLGVQRLLSDAATSPASASPRKT
jgi:hypothetical protein